MSRKIEVGTETFVRFWLVIIGFALVIAFISAAANGLLIVGLAIFLAVAINPLVKKIDPSGKRRTPAAITAVVVVVGVLGVILAAVGPTVVNETTRYFSESPSTGGQLQSGAAALDSIGRNFGVENLSGQVWGGIKDFFNKMVAGLGDTIISSVGTVMNFLTGVILVIVLTIIFLIEGPELLDKFWGFVAVRRKAASEVWRKVVTKMADVVAKYVTGQLSVAILDGVVSAVVVLIMSMIFGFSAGLAVPMGLITMTCYMIPMIGPVIGCVVVASLLFFSSPWAAVSFMVFYIIYQQLESNIIAPKVQGSRLNLPLSAILVAITIGMYVFGILGAIISIPIAGCIKVLISEYPNIKKLSE